MSLKRAVISAVKEWRNGTLVSSREARSHVQSSSLLHFASDTYSERGDDGIIAEVFRRLHVTRGFFVEFGAWDGIFLSNTRLLFEKGWPGMFIEGDPQKAATLKDNYRSYSDVICVESFVLPQRGTNGKTLDQICDEHGIQQIDFLSVDIDGLDLDIFESLERRPNLVAIEGGFSWHPGLAKRVPTEIAAQNLQQPLAVAIESVQAKGYVPICFNQNLYAITSEMAEPFANIQKDARTLWLDAFYSQTNQFRASLQRMRSKSVIREIEAVEGLREEF